MKKCVIYARVSTADRTTENQKRDLLRYCEGPGLSVVAVFEDVGVSGAKQSRPQLDEMIKQARQRRFEVVPVWKFDRFARSTSHLLPALQEFRELGIDFISYSEGIDTSSTVGKMTFTFLAEIAEFERSLIQERTFPDASVRRNSESSGEPSLRAWTSATTSSPARPWNRKTSTSPLRAMLGRLAHRLHILEANSERCRLKESKQRFKRRLQAAAPGSEGNDATAEP